MSRYLLNTTMLLDLLNHLVKGVLLSCFLKLFVFLFVTLGSWCLLCFQKHDLIDKLGLVCDILFTVLDWTCHQVLEKLNIILAGNISSFVGKLNLSIHCKQIIYCLLLPFREVKIFTIWLLNPIVCSQFDDNQGTCVDYRFFTVDECLFADETLK